VVGVTVCLLALGGCANGASWFAARDYERERARSAVLVVPALKGGEEDRVVRDVAHTLFAELSPHWFQLVDLAWVRRTSPGLETAILEAAPRLMAGHPVPPRLRSDLLALHGVEQFLLLDLFRYEQYWGRETKITRVGIEARLVHVVEGRILWQGRYDPEMSGAPGSGFDSGTRQVVREMVQTMTGGPPVFKDTPMANWPILEYLTPN
jgi:hypothetical protein